MTGTQRIEGCCYRYFPLTMAQLPVIILILIIITGSITMMEIQYTVNPRKEKPFGSERLISATATATAAAADISLVHGSIDSGRGGRAIENSHHPPTFLSQSEGRIFLNVG